MAAPFLQTLIDGWAQLRRRLGNRSAPTPQSRIQHAADGISLRPTRGGIGDDVAQAASAGDKDALIRALEARRQPPR